MPFSERRRPSCRVAVVTGATILLSLPSQTLSAQGNDRLAAAKAMYASAAYVEALQALTMEEGAEASQYRALSLLALGRADEAQEAVEALVKARPEYTVAADELPPKFVTLFTQAKQKLLPPLVMRLLASGRELFKNDELPDARKEFDRLLTLASDPTIRDLEEVADARLLASGFIDIIASRPAPRPEPVPAPPAAASSAPAAPAKPAITPAVAILQPIPQWPAAAGPAQLFADAVGEVRLRIGPDGRVKSATLQRSVHPRFDILLLAAAYKWEYKPATINGVASESETVVSFRVAP